VFSICSGLCVCVCVCAIEYGIAIVVGATTPQVITGHGKGDNRREGYVGSHQKLYDFCN